MAIVIELEKKVSCHVGIIAKRESIKTISQTTVMHMIPT